LYEQIMGNLGYHNVHSFNRSADCLNQLTQKPDIIFVDYDMDNLGGIEVLKKIKRFDPGIIVFFISEQAAIGLAISALEYGALDYITKQDISKEKIRYCLDRGTMMRLVSGIAVPTFMSFPERLFCKN